MKCHNTECDKDFSSFNPQQKYCSAKCREDVCNRRYKAKQKALKGDTSKICPCCKVRFEPFTGKQVYCSLGCRELYGKTNNIEERRAKMREYRRKYYEKLKANPRPIISRTTTEADRIRQQDRKFDEILTLHGVNYGDTR